MLINLEFFGQIFEISLNIKLHENSCSRAELFHADRQAHMTQITVALRNFANSPRNTLQIYLQEFKIRVFRRMWDCRFQMTTRNPGERDILLIRNYIVSWLTMAFDKF
jgi:hypothetical protein